MSDEEKVKAKWPEAVFFKCTGYWRIYRSPKIAEDSEIISDPFRSLDEAWADAARKLDGAK